MDVERLMPSPLRDDRKMAIKKLRHLIYSSRQSPALFRKKLEQAFYAPHLPQQVECREMQVGTVFCDMLTPRAYSKNRLIFYVHGGSFVGGSSRAWRNFCASLAHECAARLVIPNCRLAPAFAFPTAVEDLQIAFRELFNVELAAAKKDMLLPPELIVAADSSGASLALALLLNMREQVREHIKTVLLFSPWVDLSPRSVFFSGKKNTSDDIINAAAYKTSADLYTYASNLENPLVSPVKADPSSLLNFPPLYIQMGGKELLRADVERFCALLKQANVSYVLDVWEGMMHLFQMADEYLAESHQAVQRIGSYVCRRPTGDSQ
jgi:acetyl esterase/lipase